jgi:hypothetical protein
VKEPPADACQTIIGEDQASPRSASAIESREARSANNDRRSSGSRKTQEDANKNMPRRRYSSQLIEALICSISSVEAAVSAVRALVSSACTVLSELSAQGLAW